MFSPSQLMQTLAQRTPASMPKPVELTPGQVFKGTVIKQYPDNMALVQIGGMQIQAKMEARLEPGQKAWLQVQPSADVVTLKVLDASSGAVGQDTSMEGLIRSLGLPETKESRVIIQALLNANLPVSHETVQAFTGVAQRLGMDDATIDAFMMAVKRNLPLTPDTVAGLKAFLSEKPLGQMIQNFLKQAAIFLDQGGETKTPAGQSAGQGQATQATGTDMRQLVSQLKEKVAGLPLFISDTDHADVDMPLRQATDNRLSATASNGQAQTSSVTSGRQVQQQVMTANGLMNSAAEEKQIDPMQNQMNGAKVFGKGENQPSANIAQPGRAVSDPDVTGEGLSNPPGMQTPGNVGKATMSQTEGQTILISSNDLPQPKKEAATSRLVDRVTADPNPASAVPASSRSHPIVELFRQMGVAHERDLMGQALSGGSLDAGAQKQMETVKSMLLQISQSSAQAVPAALREAADQLLQQVTGQQLMMVQPTSHALSQIVMQIPIRSAQGEETAYVQIESKKKGGGQVDAENCRLFFHLDLQSLGTTMIDVCIVNRIVNLQIFNDTPWVETLAQGMRDGLAQQMQEVGYQLSAMRVQSIPEERNKVSGPTSAKGGLLADYKGVDLRI